MAELFKVNAPVRKPLFEGVQGENEARSIQFDITPWVEELGDGAVTATAKRSQDSQPYPVTVTKDGTTVTWKPTSTDTAFAGVGSFQLEYTVDSVLAKTCIWSTMVAPSLDPAGDPPDPYDNWLAEMREIAADAIQAAQDADESADDAQAEVYEAEAWAKGTKNGTPVSSSDAQYQNNAKYFAEESYKNAEAWAVGQRGGVDVPSTDPTYHNNAKYWAEQSLANQYGAFIVKSASGDIASFTDGADNVPMKSLNVTITPKQSGSGDPSPSNVRPITGTSTATVGVNGVNMWDEEWEAGGLSDTDGSPIAGSNRIRSKNFIAIAPNTAYYFKCKPLTPTWCSVKYFDASLNYLTHAEPNINTAFTTPANAKFVKFNTNGVYGSSYTNDISINYPSTDTDYHPYNGHTTPVPLGQTVYGGTVNPISGELSITYVDLTIATAPRIDFGTSTLGVPYLDIFKPNAQGSINRKAICNEYKHILTTDTGVSGAFKHYDTAFTVYDSRFTSKEQAVQLLTNEGFKIVYERYQPIESTIDPVSVPSLLGTNNVWADCGSVEVEYRADPTLAYNELANVIVSLGGNL